MPKSPCHRYSLPVFAMTIRVLSSCKILYHTRNEERNGARERIRGLAQPSLLNASAVSRRRRRRRGRLLLRHRDRPIVLVLESSSVIVPRRFSVRLCESGSLPCRRRERGLFLSTSVQMGARERVVHGRTSVRQGRMGRARILMREGEKIAGGSQTSAGRFRPTCTEFCETTYRNRIE